MDRINLPEIGKQDFQDLRSSHLIGFSNKFEFIRIFGREFLSNLIEMGHGFRWIQTLPTMQAPFS